MRASGIAECGTVLLALGEGQLEEAEASLVTAAEMRPDHDEPGVAPQPSIARGDDRLRLLTAEHRLRDLRGVGERAVVVDLDEGAGAEEGFFFGGEQRRVVHQRVGAVGDGPVEGGAGGEDMSEITYEGYGTDGVAFLVEVLTDNKNRTLAEIKHAFNRAGGSLASAGSVSWQFEQKGCDSDHLTIPATGSAESREKPICS